MIGVVGSVVGAVLDAPAGVVSAARTGADGDVSIGDLHFRLAITDTNQYQRATAQFRKDQLDASATPGDQSLTGWWTRGQFSFNKGSGVTYYEVEEGDTVLNRYNDSTGVDPFTPGKVTLCPDWTTATSTAHVATTFAGSAGTKLIVLDGGTIYYGGLGGAGTSYTPAAATVVAAATGNGDVFTANSNKTITRLDLPSGTATVIYSHANNLTAIFFAKDRLFVVDDTNTFYQLVPEPPGVLPVALAAGDKVFTVSGDQGWSCVDTPGPVLLANTNRIFAVTVDASGDIPTLSGPIQVADLPPGETIRAMAFHLGFLIIATITGVRVAAVSDSGTVSYGPLLIDFGGKLGLTSIARHGSRVVVCGDHKLYDIDLSEQIGDGLEFGWAKLPSPFVGTEANYGAVQAPDRSVLAWSDSVIKYQSGTNLTASGDLTTGYHRFATLEPKRFESVKIRASGSGGSIIVSRVDADGTVTSLYTLNLAVDKTAEVGLQMPDAVEAVALKFTLTPKSGDATVGPTLLGYQLKALPEPIRQRIIQLPLEIKDVERRQPARATGRTGGAWERLQALEELETSGATTQYQDFRTGESATVYIEQMQFVNMTPPTNNSTGFGGVALVVLRKL